MSAAAFEPNFIDWRASRGRADRRAEADDPTLEICAHCETEIDVAQPAHRPNCAGIGAPRASSATVVSLPPPEKKVPIKHHHSSDARCRVPGCKWQARQDQPDGLELLERMDAGLPLGDVEAEPELEEVPEESIGADGIGTSSSAGDDVLEEEAQVDRGSTGSSRSPSPRILGEPASSSSTAGTHGNKHVSLASDLWPRERMIAAVTAYADEHGRLPMQREWMGPSSGDHPNVGLVNKVFGNWGNLIVEAGFPRPRRGGKPLVVGDKIQGAPRAVDVPPSPAERAPIPEPPRAPARSADPPPDLRAFASAAIAAARTFADTLEAELARD